MRRLEELPASDLIHPRIPKAPKLPRLDRTPRQVDEPKREPAPARRESHAPATRRRMADDRDGDAVGPGARPKSQAKADAQAKVDAQAKAQARAQSLAAPSVPAPKGSLLDDRKWASKAMGACAAIGLVGTVVIWLAR